MRGLLPIVALAALAACNQNQSADQSAQAEATPAAPATPHSNAAPGTFVRTAADGKVTTLFLATDGTYTEWMAGAMTDSGTWSVEDNKSCFKSKDADKPQCSTDGPMGADGTFTETPDDGQPYTVQKTA
jgi:hypothetical protein